MIVSTVLRRIIHSEQTLGICKPFFYSTLKCSSKVYRFNNNKLNLNSQFARLMNTQSPGSRRRGRDLKEEEERVIDTSEIVPFGEVFDEIQYSERAAEVKAADLLNEIDRLINEQEDYPAAELLLITAFSFTEKHSHLSDTIKGSLEISSAFVNHIYRMDYEKADQLYQSGLKKVLADPDYPKRSIGLIYLRQAELLSFTGKSEEAIQKCTEAIKIFEAIDPNNELIAMGLSNLSAYLCVNGLYNEAIPHSKRSLQIFTKVLGRQSEMAKLASFNLAKIYTKLQMKKELEELDNLFAKRDSGILTPTNETIPNKFVEKAKNQWNESQGGRIFDLPGVSKSTFVSSLGHRAFLNEWKKQGQPFEGYYKDILTDELESINYAHNQLRPHLPKPVQPPQLPMPKPDDELHPEEKAIQKIDQFLEKIGISQKDILESDSEDYVAQYEAFQNYWEKKDYDNAMGELNNEPPVVEPGKEDEHIAKIIEKQFGYFASTPFDETDFENAHTNENTQNTNENESTNENTPTDEIPTNETPDQK